MLIWDKRQINVIVGHDNATNKIVLYSSSNHAVANVSANVKEIEVEPESGVESITIVNGDIVLEMEK